MLGRISGATAEGHWLASLNSIINSYQIHLTDTLQYTPNPFLAILSAWTEDKHKRFNTFEFILISAVYQDAKTVSYDHISTL